VFGLDVDAILRPDLDVLHIQYHHLLYNRRKLLEVMRRFEGVLALTYHDDSVPRATFPYTMPDLLYAHREDVGIGSRRLIPQGIDVRPPVIKTFGLGKSRGDIIAEVCERNGWHFEKSFGEKRWLDTEELYRWLRDCDAIVLWYDENLGSGGSGAAPLAIATRRPVFVNDVDPFRDLPDRLPTLRKVASVTDLESEMRALLVDDYAEARSWDRVAATLVKDYHEAVAARSQVSEKGAAGRPRRPLRDFGFVALDQKPLVLSKNRMLGRLPRSD
jgi:anaerobic selenocysteine-containing dehydrogenase